MRAHAIAIASCIVLALSSGCYTHALGTGRVMRTAADERVVTAMPVGQDSKHGQVIPSQITCAEPSPDVQKIISTTTELASQLEGSLNNPQTATQGSVNTTLALSTARAEAVAQLTQRLATIQLLRDGLYRACEAYANGAISDTAYALVLSRYGDVMVTMLLGELAAGKSPAMIALGSTAEGGADGGAGSSGSADGTAATDGATTPSHAGIGNAHSRASAGSTNGAEVIAASNEIATAEVADRLVQLQRGFINNDQLGPLLVACVSALDRHDAANGGLTPFAQVCLNAMDQINPKLPVMLDAKIRDRMQPFDAQPLIRPVVMRSVAP